MSSIWPLIYVYHFLNLILQKPLLPEVKHLLNHILLLRVRVEHCVARIGYVDQLLRMLQWFQTEGEECDILPQLVTY